MKLVLTSDAFREGETIPTAYTGDGDDKSPALAWRNHEQKTQTFALICDDPDAPRGTYTHWLLYNLPAECSALPDGMPPHESLPDGSMQGKNDFGKIGYGGPAPPPGKPHRYYFKLYALDTRLGLKPGVGKAQLESAMKGHIVAEGVLMGTYGRKPR
jgi:Raf kinase inhibitor-like YbhB/YbcL family protein